MLPFTEKEKIATDIRFKERYIKKKKPVIISQSWVTLARILNFAWLNKYIPTGGWLSPRLTGKPSVPTRCVSACLKSLSTKMGYYIKENKVNKKRLLNIHLNLRLRERNLHLRSIIPNKELFQHKANEFLLWGGLLRNYLK